ncbi:MAG: RNA polymerase sigma-70 factor [Chitinophagaceae bacterium]|nr:RNA polymerase sigma-70 factor [Chitinophagaceae bacterium]
MKIDNALIKNLQTQIGKSDQKAFEDLYRLFFPRLFKFCILYVERKEAAEEIVNDIMVKIWRSREEIAAIQILETYLFVAVRNHSLNYLQKYSKIHVSIEPEPGAAEMASLHNPEKELEWKEMNLKLQLAIEQLPEQCRTVFKLIKEEGFRYKQVAEILNISPRTVETQLFRAIKKLSTAVASFQDDSSKKNPKNGLPLSLLVLLIFAI